MKRKAIDTIETAEALAALSSLTRASTNVLSRMAGMVKRRTPAYRRDVLALNLALAQAETTLQKARAR